VIITAIDLREVFDLGESIRRACVLEAAAAKPGNVHPGAAFADLTYADFVRSAEAVAPVLVRAAELGVGRAVFEAVEATRAVVRSNTNLGIVLLLAPLAAVPLERTLKDGIGDVLQQLTRDDAAWVYRAIRLVQPGGLGSAESEDIASEPSGTLREVMQLAADRDGVATQYANNFAWVLDEGAPFLIASPNFVTDPEQAIIELQLRLLAAHPDTLIARKCGTVMAEEVSQRAQNVLNVGGIQTDIGRTELAEFDLWLRADGNRRNPGTTADLIAACLFAALRDRLRISTSTTDVGRALLPVERS
jgi:triphosphoribosyl-dephospho-CoA synthase